MTTSFLPITTARCTLRLFEERDLQAFTAYRADPEVARYQSWSSYSMDDARKFLEDQRRTAPGTPGTWTQVAVADKESGALLGDCGVHFVDADQVELGFTLAQSSQGRGLMREAVTALLDCLFGALGKHRVFAITDARNEGAARLLAGLGFRREAHFVENVFFKGAWGDEHLFACLAREWKGRRT